MKWYLNSNVVDVAKQLLGKVLCTRFDGVLTRGKIVETEAYCGNNDKACHANNQKMTKRNTVMFSAGGSAYVYLCYGIHHLFNVVTNEEGQADAVLIRAIEPIKGIEKMMTRRNLSIKEKRISGGPAMLTQALGINTFHNGTVLNGESIWIEDALPMDEDYIASATRIGVEYAEEDALKPWRFFIKENSWVSRF